MFFPSFSLLLYDLSHSHMPSSFFHERESVKLNFNFPPTTVACTYVCVCMSAPPSTFVPLRGVVPKIQISDISFSPPLCFAYFRFALSPSLMHPSSFTLLGRSSKHICKRSNLSAKRKKELGAFKMSFYLSMKIITKKDSKLKITQEGKKTESTMPPFFFPVVYSWIE